MMYLVDSGADFSLYPLWATADNIWEQKETAKIFEAADGTVFKSLGSITCTLDLSSGIKFIWQFDVADMNETYGLLGADFLYHKHLYVDFRNERLYFHPRCLPDFQCNSRYRRYPLQEGYRLFVTDMTSNLMSLVDTGSSVCVYPLSALGDRRGRFEKTNGVVRVANNKMRTCGTLEHSLDLGLGANFTWKFLVAKVSCIIIGADLLSFYKLVVNMDSIKLMDYENWQKGTKSKQASLVGENKSLRPLNHQVGSITGGVEKCK